ncbi:transmembrane protein 63C-like protein [Leptotrombidium deliense]|uniref:Transmembrane protein 63C-like protein n=1 Tax=Leptotrombidium deliense TaxID=299467 RepID=A0A443SW47_9ACAR|nr:transmembrane protein 63C-like protein [Leptotrombidium deliense]
MVQEGKPLRVNTFPIHFFSFDDSNNTTSNDTGCSSFTNRTPSKYDIPGWEGIPINLVINTIVFIAMMLLFTCLRKKAWNNKSRQLTRTHKGWIHFIYGDRENEVKQICTSNTNEHHVHDLRQMNPILPPQMQQLPSPSSQADASASITSDVTVEVDLVSNGVNPSVSNDSVVNRNYEHITGDNDTENDAEDPTESDRKSKLFKRTISKQFGYRILDTLLIKDNDILRHKGSDAGEWIQVFLLFLILMLYLYAEGADKPFARTTISNLETESKLLWVHVVISMLLLPIGLLLMCHFSRTIKADDEQIVRRTLYIRRVPRSKRYKEMMLKYFQTHIPDVVIEGIQFVYDTRKLNELHLEYDSVVNAKYYCEEYWTEYRKRCQVRPYFMGHFGCVVCCDCELVDGLTHYTKREQELERDLEKEFRNIISHPTGSVFITFQTERMAQKVYKVLRENQEKTCSFCSCCNCCFRIGSWFLHLFNQQANDEYEASRWTVSYAPYPDDINWEDSAVDYKMLWLRRILIHVLLFVLFFFLSTPSIVLSVLSYARIQETLYKTLDFSPLLTEYIGPLLMVIASLILPVFVALACQYLPYKTLSELNHSIMWKVFLFLIMMVIILPSLGLTSAKALLEKIANRESAFRWECLFPVDSGAFFVNYVLQSTLLGNAMELLRFPELFLYFFYLIFSSRTQAEYESARKLVIFDFAFGVRYPRYLLILTMVVTYSLSCPLIVPCGLLYMIIKHLVDRYNIYYVYVPSKISGRIHSTAIMFFHIAILMMQFQMFAFSFLRSSNSDVTNFSMITLIVAILVFSGHCFFHFFWNINHLTYMAVARGPAAKKSQRKEFCACAYIPRVLCDINVHGIVPPESQAPKNYGAVSPPLISVPVASSSIPSNNSSQHLDAATLTM